MARSLNTEAGREKKIRQKSQGKKYVIELGEGKNELNSNEVNRTQF